MSELTIRISSFSFKREHPKDPTEHGGGFVFDCRCLPNPGREAAYKDKTGLDTEVIDYLDNLEEVKDFQSQIQKLLDQAIANYLERGFENLMVSFGCTGGQHRSVYFARVFSDILSKRTGIQVELNHLGLLELGKL